MRVAQADVARRAGVTQAAVSLILRGKATSIPEATRQRVLAAARELGYRADPLARRLASGRSQLLGVFTYERVFSAAQRNYYHPFLLGVEEAAEVSGHDLLLFTSAATSGPVRSIHAGGENKLRLVDAAVLLGRDEIPAELEELVSEGYPFVFIGRRYLADGREVPNVAPDYAAASRSLGARLAGLGHRRVAYLGSNAALPATADRLAGLRDSGAAVFPWFGPATEIDDRSADCLSSHQITAAVAENAVYADAVLPIGGKLPGGLSVAVAGIVEGSEGSDWSGYRIPGRAVGRLAVDDVLARLDGAAPRTRLVDCPMQHGATIWPAPRRPRRPRRPRSAPPAARRDRGT